MKLSISLLAFVLGTLSVISTEPADFIRFQTTRVIVFKDGHALIIKQGAAKTDAHGTIHTTEVPDAAVLGSFWATAKQGELIGMRAGWSEEKSTHTISEPCADHFQLLEANQGRQCKILVDNGREIFGTIRATIATSRTTAVGDPVVRALPNFTDSATATVTGSRQTRTGAHVIISGNDGDQSIAIADIKSLIVREMNLHRESDLIVSRREKRLTFSFHEPNVQREITLMYFRPGIRWIPTYRINLPDTDKEKAALTMQAELINEAEDLIDTPIDIVVGVPNFRFKTTPSPLVLESTMRNALRQAAPMLAGQMAQGFSNASYQMRATEHHRPAPVAPAPVNLPGELTGAQSQDLFIYNLPDATLKKGERMAMNIVEMKVPFRNVYTWNLHITRHDIATAPSNAGTSPLKLSENRVWRQIDLTNASQVPWTTGAVMIMQGHQPLAQELLTYTSIGSACRVPVTVSIDTHGSVDAKEISRKLSALTWDRYKYALIQNEAKLSVMNHKQTPINLELNVRLGGRVSEASDEGVITLHPFEQADWLHYRGSTAVNNSSRVVWKTTVEPGVSFCPMISHEFYTRH